MPSLWPGSRGARSDLEQVLHDRRRVSVAVVGGGVLGQLLDRPRRCEVTQLVRRHGGCSAVYAVPPCSLLDPSLLLDLPFHDRLAYKPRPEEKCQPSRKGAFALLAVRNIYLGPGGELTALFCEAA